MNWVFIGILILSLIQIGGNITYFALGPLNLNFTYKFLTPSDVPQYTTTNDFVDEMARYNIEWVFEVTVMWDVFLPWAIMTVYNLIITNSLEGIGLLYLYIVIDFVFQLKFIWRLIVLFDCTQFGQICRNPNPLKSTHNTSFNDNQTWQVIFWYNFSVIFWLFIWLSVIYYIPKTAKQEQIKLVDVVLSRKGYSRHEIDIVKSRLKETEEDIGNTKEMLPSLNLDNSRQVFNPQKTYPIYPTKPTNTFPNLNENKRKEKITGNLDRRGTKIKTG